MSFFFLFSPACFPIRIPSDDPHFKDTCMEFVRSVPAWSDCQIGLFFVRLFSIYLGTREQITDITSLIDGGSVYGNTYEQMEKLGDKNTGLVTIILLFIILKKKTFLTPIALKNVQ